MHSSITRYDDLLRNNDARDIAFQCDMCERGIFMLPTALKHNQVPASYTDDDIARTLEAARVVLATRLV